MDPVFNGWKSLPIISQIQFAVSATMRTYTQHTQGQRYQIWAIMKTGENQNERRKQDL